MTSVSATASDTGLFGTAAAWTWRRLLRWAALGAIVVLTAMGLVLRDRLPLGLAVVAGVGLELLHWRRRWVGVLVLGILFADTTAWTLSATVVNALQGEELIRLLIPASLSAIAGAGVIAALVILVLRRDWETGGRPVRIVLLGALLFFLVIMGIGAANAGRAIATPAAGAIVLRTENLAFATSELSAPSGQVTVEIDNRDVWWHTFTIDALHVDVQVPSSGKRQVTFNAAPGTYTFYCAIPGHAAMGMRGTLIVK